ncbi:unnamed protein product [Bursaphelenchus okinawaensis]|uniref:TGF-beta family profile domain-containing protein n=1 Tax=Bursaphelenchus okinawaensis TaxID=465554 RepID=A0A811KXR7_9BILA|nr:unnamed protein product [Bursaphelenchus okinawaensis]CAG9113976.1 unnamed protein product [Bursaphelenchus okinawaensis]
MRQKPAIPLPVLSLILLVHLSTANFPSKHTSKTNDVVDNKAQEYFGKFEQVFGVHAAKERPHPTRYDVASQRDAVRYMHKLFTANAKHQDLGSNSIIAVFPDKGPKTTLTFNISHLDQSYVIDRAELHLRTRKPADLLNTYIDVSCASCSTESSYLKVNPTSSVHQHWLRFDLTDLVDDALRNSRGKISTDPKRIYSNISLPLPWKSAFLTVEVYNSTVIQKKNEVKHKNAKRRHKRSLEDYYRYMPTNDDSDENSILRGEYRAYRADDSLEQLKSHDETIFKRNYNMVKNAGPRILQSRPKQPKKKYRNKFSKNDPMMGFGQNYDEYTTTEKIPSLSFFDNEVSVQLLGQDNGTKNKHKQCQRRERTVSFREIGWDKWIIAPKEFPADYCSGTCEFPLEQQHHATNHAQLQSILHTLGGDKSDIPDVCCAPQKLDSLTLLYYDENGNVVLKSFPKMVVSSCGCV